jgi:hypothetical protein
MQNKPNLGNNKMNISDYLTMSYVKFRNLKGWKNKANSNPIKPKQTQFKANQTQFEERPKMPEFTLDVSSLALEFTLGVCLLAFLPGIGGFCVDKELYVCF